MPSSFPVHGAHPHNDAVTFRVWAPAADAVALELKDGPSLALSETEGGLFARTTDAAAPGTRYRFRLDDDGPFPDPASRHQPEGVHGPSEVVDPTAYDWGDAGWAGVAREDLVVYELHVGTFTEAGTFDAIREQLTYLRDLGITAIELMPVHGFPGARNWGYDPAAWFAPARTYGRPGALRRLVDAAHQTGLAVILDVIYNHLGPDGAYLNAFGPVLTDTHETPWGAAVNLDDEGAEGVRRFFVDNALHWLREYHIDGLRLDATHALHDESEPHFLAALSAAVDNHIDGPERFLIAEDSRNQPPLVQPRDADGHGLDAVWSNDLHHQLRVFTAGDTQGYYRDFQSTTTDDIATTLRDGWFFRGGHSEHVGGPRGTDPAPVDRTQCVVFIQNHDQVGNRPAGNRLTDDVSPATYRALSVLVCVVQEIPLLFMGQEWAASTPFQFFTDHNDEIGPRVTEGRTEEFADVSGFAGDVPDPQAKATFERSVLDWDEPRRPPHDGVLALYHDLLALRPQLGDEMRVDARSDTTLLLERPPVHIIVNLKGAAQVDMPSALTAILHTEQSGYTVAPQPPVVSADAVSFSRAGAVVLGAA
ncbi:malto-oligosyltrehalose trehalohydrolase [Salinibacter altiplanensis]|uniref:malto-oligosyltrehalose trehalohydrolase n=1 Tax=Salinibacter altiplanensis TaxID=1803181 RepID=UPI000C9FEE89|nr:malto-oligosyltrehalose trehalohydrolase [Salinibacter altiplanensis]